jgi:hypothetical protein
VTRNRPLLRWLHIISLVYGIVIEQGTLALPVNDLLNSG